MRIPALQRFMLPSDVTGIAGGIEIDREDIELYENPKLFVVTPPQSRTAATNYKDQETYESDLRDIEAKHDDLFDYTVRNVITEKDPESGLILVKLRPDKKTLEGLWEERTEIGEFIGAPAQEPRDIVIGTAKTGEAAREISYSAIRYLKPLDDYIALDEMKFTSR